MLKEMVTFDGFELVNARRTLSLLQNGVAPGFSGTADPDCVCPDISGHSDGDICAAPWFDGSDPATASFAGALLSSFTRTSPFQNRRVTRTVSGGGVLGALRTAAVTYRLAGSIYGTQLGIERGKAWMSSVVSGGHCASTSSCGFADLEYYSACPHPTCGIDCCDFSPSGNLEANIEAKDLLRRAPRVGLSSLQFGEPVSGAPCHVVPFTIDLVGETPYAYGPWSESLPLTTFPTDVMYDAEYFCIDDSLTTFVSDCDRGSLPEIPTSVFQSCFCEPTHTFRSCFELENRSQTDSVVPEITIAAGSSDLRNLRISFFEFDQGGTCLACDASVPDQTFADRFRGAIEVPHIPVGSTMVIDGAEKSSTLTLANTRELDGGQYLTAGNGAPFSFPTVGPCKKYCFRAYADCRGTASDANISMRRASCFLTGG